MEELLFWTISYIALNCAFNVFFENAVITALINTVFAAVLVLSIVLRKNFSKRMGFTFQKKGIIAAIPLFTYAVINVIYFESAQKPEVTITLCAAAVTEEILFRGYLLNLTKKMTPTVSILVNALIFAAYHLISGSVSQAAAAFCIGFAFASYTSFYKSFVPCMAAHLMTNITGGGKVPNTALALCFAITLIYSVTICLKVKEN